MDDSGAEPQFPPAPTVEMLTEFGPGDLQDLSDAAEAAIKDGGGFGWISPPPRETLEAFWRGVLLIPERDLFVGRLDGVIAGSCQIQKPARNNEAQRHTCSYERLGYIRFGSLPHYAYVRDGFVAGHFFYKELDAA